MGQSEEQGFFPAPFPLDVYKRQPITWALSSVAFLIYFLRGDWLHYLERKERAA